MDPDDLELFERTLRHATEHHTGAELDHALHELGWVEALSEDPAAAVSLLFALQGEANVSSSALDHVALSALHREPSDPTGVVFPAIGRWEPPGEIVGESICIDGLATATFSEHEHALVIAPADGKDAAVIVPTAALEQRAVTGLDPRLGLVTVTGTAPRLETEPAAERGWPAAVALAQLAIGHELVGASRAMLELARQHALEREQFGQPIAKFQAVRHRLAETLVAIETADAVLDAAWLDRSPLTASMAKALAGRGARTAARHCQQVLAGIGFTTEHPLHNFVRRVVVLDELFGPARSLTRDLGEELLTSRRLPRPLPL